MQLIAEFNAVHSLSFDGVPCGLAIKDELASREGIPQDMIIIRVDGLVIGDDEYISAEATFVRASLANALVGGKGGFGAMLRSLAKQAGKKKTTDFGACRDLSGRRLRHVNDDMVLQKWKEAKDRGEDFDAEQETASGLDLWFLSTPSWADGIKVDHKKRFMKPRRKTTICMDWKRARERHPAPEGAPASWGCPRGRRCEYAHGEEELRGVAADDLVAEKSSKKKEEESRKRTAYLASVHTRRSEEDSFQDMIAQGLQASKRARIEQATKEEEEEEQEKTVKKPSSEAVAADGILPIEGLEIPVALATAATVNKGSALVPKNPFKEAYSAPSTTSSIPTPAKVAPRPAPVWLKPLNGELELTCDGEIEGRGDFNTCAVADCAITDGRWYYEVELLSAGLTQIGWADQLFSALVVVSPKIQTTKAVVATAAAAGAAGSRGGRGRGNGDNNADVDEVEEEEEEGADGVGDDEHSWAYDGLRQKKWNKEDHDFGTTDKEGKKRDPWKVGDVIGCLLEVTGSDRVKNIKISFTLNGEYLGEAFGGPSDTATAAAVTAALGTATAAVAAKKGGQKRAAAVAVSSSSSSSVAAGAAVGKGKDGVGAAKGLFPAISLEEGEAVLLNIGQYPFQYTPSPTIGTTAVTTTAAVAEKAAASPEGPKTNKGGKGGKKGSAAAAKKTAAAAAVAKKGRALVEDVQQSGGNDDSQQQQEQQQAYRPVLEALGEDTRKLVPISNEGLAARRTDTHTTSSATSSGASASATATAITTSAAAPALNYSTSSSSSSSSSAGGPAVKNHHKEESGGTSKPATATAATNAAKNAVGGGIQAEPQQQQQQLQVFDAIDLESSQYSSADDLALLGLAHLKAELDRRGLKAGGSLQERAVRLLSVRGVPVDKIDPKLKAKTPKTK